MSEVKITDMLYLVYLHDDMYSIEKRTDTHFNCMMVTPKELDALAMHAPIVKRMVTKLAQLDNFYPNDEELEQLLDDIAELERAK